MAFIENIVRCMLENKEILGLVANLTIAVSSVVVAVMTVRSRNK